jgi:hypothetical protein
VPIGPGHHHLGLYPIAICSSCNARWIQDGHQQRAINQV